MIFKPGKLYRFSDEYSVRVFPTKELANMPASNAPSSVQEEYWAKRAKCQLRFGEPGDIFMLLKRDGRFLHILLGEKEGWISYIKWGRVDIKLEEVPK